MKIRSVRPEFFADPTMVELTPEARLLYIGLWCYVDDDGRGEWLPKQIDGQIFPLEGVDIYALLGQLVSTARIVRYSDGDRDFFYIPTFTEYQRPNRKYESKLPDPAECAVLPGETPLPLPTQRVSTADAHAVAVEGEVEGEGVELLAPKAARDRVWDTLAEVFGEPTTRTNRSLRGKVVKSLAGAGATRDQIVDRVRAWPLHFPDATLTETALEKHWDRLGLPPAKASRADVERYETEARLAEGELRARQLDRGLPA
jgi:hypothetical protein